MSISEANSAAPAGWQTKTTPGPRKVKRIAGHQQGAALVIIFAALWTQLVAAVTLVVMWYSWQDRAFLAWPDNDRVILMSATLLTVLLVSYILAGRFWRRKAAERSTFLHIWYTSGAAAGAWFGLPLYLSVTWDHLVGGGHDPFTIISVGAIFIGAGGVAGVGLAVPSEPVAYWFYTHVRERAARWEEARGTRAGKWRWRLLTLAFAPLILALGALLTFGTLLLTGPGPLSDPAYKNETFAGETQVVNACLETVRQYDTSDAPETVFEYYRQLAQKHKFSEVTAVGQIDKAALGLLAEKLEVGPLTAAVRYSNTPFKVSGPVSGYSPYRSGSESCRSIRVILTPANTGGTKLWLVNEKPVHVH
jgi:hypothetical protein